METWKAFLESQRSLEERLTTPLSLSYRIKLWNQYYSWLLRGGKFDRIKKKLDENEIIEYSRILFELADDQKFSFFIIIDAIRWGSNPIMSFEDDCTLYRVTRNGLLDHALFIISQISENELKALPVTHFNQGFLHLLCQHPYSSLQMKILLKVLPFLSREQINTIDGLDKSPLCYAWEHKNYNVIQKLILAESSVFSTLEYFLHQIDLRNSPIDYRLPVPSFTSSHRISEGLLLFRFYEEEKKSQSKQQQTGEDLRNKDNEVTAPPRFPAPDHHQKKKVQKSEQIQQRQKKSEEMKEKMIQKKLMDRINQQFDENVYNIGHQKTTKKPAPSSQPSSSYVPPPPPTDS